MWTTHLVSEPLPPPPNTFPRFSYPHLHTCRLNLQRWQILCGNKEEQNTFAWVDMAVCTLRLYRAYTEKRLHTLWCALSFNLIFVYSLFFKKTHIIHWRAASLPKHSERLSGYIVNRNYCFVTKHSSYFKRLNSDCSFKSLKPIRNTIKSIL
jgi:hypothetical protein